MKVLILHQPEFSGNYHLHLHLAKELKIRFGYEAYTLEQLHGRPVYDEYVQTIKELDPDIIYFEMLDHETFKVLELFPKKLKILCYCSRGILSNFEDILQYKGIWYDKVITNSKYMYKTFKNNNIDSEHFTYYYTALDDSEITFDINYAHECVFLGMGVHRLTQPQYDLERNLFFMNDQLKSDFEVAFYGKGWPEEWKESKGLLPHGNIGKLYRSAYTGIAMIEDKQRSMGMINNRYTEMMKSGISILTYDYPDIDWYGAEEFFHFVNTPEDVVEKIEQLLDYVYQAELLENGKKFIEDKNNEFYEKVGTLLK